MQPEDNIPADGAQWSVIVRHYEECLAAYGATPRGVDWPNADDLAARFGVMLELAAKVESRPVLLDLGCGPGLLLDYLKATGRLGDFDYLGIDRSEVMVEHARARWPAYEFSCRDIITDPLPDRSVDLVIMNGVLTERITLAVDTMKLLAQSLIAAAFRLARIGIAFNVMNAHVDWQREDLFYWPFDALATFLKERVSRHYVFRSDYGLYEYTCLVRRSAHRPSAPDVKIW